LRERVFKILSYILAVSAFGLIAFSIYKSDEPVSVIRGNKLGYPLPFTLNKTNDTISKMLIRSYENACEVVKESGDTYFFAEPADMILWLKEQPIGEKMKLWVYTIDTKRWIDANLAWYGVRDKTIMGYGFGAREGKTKESIDFKEMRRRVLHNETLLNPKIRKRLLEDNYER